LFTSSQYSSVAHSGNPHPPVVGVEVVGGDGVGVDGGVGGDVPS
jgi:hypothetical protein